MLARFTQWKQWYSNIRFCNSWNMTKANSCKSKDVNREKERNHTNRSHASWSVLVFIATAWCCSCSSLNKSKVSSTCVTAVQKHCDGVGQRNNHTRIWMSRMTHIYLKKNIITCLYAFCQSVHIVLILFFCL